MRWNKGTGTEMSNLPQVDPAKRSALDLGWPPQLPIELALRTHTPKELCAAYGIEKAEWDELKLDPNFRAAVQAAMDEVRKDGVSFKLKARLMAEDYLANAYRMVNDKTGNVPANVKADLIKFTMRCAGFEKAGVDGALGSAQVTQININLG